MSDDTTRHHDDSIDERAQQFAHQANSTCATLFFTVQQLVHLFEPYAVVQGIGFLLAKLSMIILEGLAVSEDRSIDRDASITAFHERLVRMLEGIKASIDTHATVCHDRCRAQEERGATATAPSAPPVFILPTAKGSH